MIKDSMDLFLTDYYRILKVLDENQVNVNNNEKFVPLTQMEVAKLIGVSKITMNFMFKELHRQKFIYSYKGKKGIYCLSEKSQIILKEIRRINNYISKL
ncbi:MAG: Rrf2 family transcriptional regulator [Clostridium perfringens]|uniref:Rrf2 family transcriptional regulator n=1 Tax=Clostridium perfringens TaxID=1502 RepID=UPI001896E6BD|nr:Rrf2 family transcriptional regulator [Clostridium perfringens]EJT6474281.1 Rrf2 family transcriptional regulator [Clostridium perfringens]EJT6479815.1 Rrf2 family transcriptional regulator [Clostridium perfringens]EJT6531186.1 Rrf2 family transcriptional regulator [Clostridium perfringens]MCX0356148.1 Rrf2 family transcriptional regulator [Clostridium perfringens]MDK0662829.1 Rrf2 family transcriptional regulator [Clostridium perfringens]